MSFIEVIIPYEPWSRLGVSCNRAMEKASDWVLFLDHDIFLCNPNWYEICIRAIGKVGKNAGWITCVTNNIPSAVQQASPFCKGMPRNNVLDDHIKYAHELYKMYGERIDLIEHNPVDETKGPDFCGYFILTHKEAWESVGGFRPDFYIDCWYGWALWEKGYKMYRMPGLYVYHLWKEKQRLWGGWADWKGVTGYPRGC